MDLQEGSGGAGAAEAVQQGGVPADPGGLWAAGGAAAGVGLYCRQQRVVQRALSDYGWLSRLDLDPLFQR